MLVIVTLVACFVLHFLKRGREMRRVQGKYLPVRLMIIFSSILLFVTMVYMVTVTEDLFFFYKELLAI